MLIRQHRMGDAVISHSRAISQVDFSSASLLATCGHDLKVRVWNWASKRLVHQFAGSQFSFAPDGHTLFVATSERRDAATSYGKIHFTVANLIKYDLDTGDRIVEGEPAEIEICALAVSPQGNLVAASRLTQPAIFHDAQTLKPRFMLKPPQNGTVGCIQFLDENRVLTKGYTVHDYDAVVYLWDLQSRQPILTFSGARTPLSVSPGGHYAAAGTERGLLRVWDLRDGSVVRELVYSDEAWVAKTAFLQQGTCVAAVGQGNLNAQNGRLRVWKIATGELIEDWQPTGNPRTLSCVCVSPDNRWIVAGAADGRLRIWDWQARSEVPSLTGHTHYVQSVVCLDNANLITSGGEDCSVRRWTLDDGKSVAIERTFEEAVGKLAYSPLCGLLASAHPDAVRLWQPHAGSISRANSLLGELPHPQVRDLHFTSTGHRLATSGSDGSIRLWDLQTRSELFRLEIHDADSDSFICWMALCPDETKVAFTQLWSGSVAIWDWQARTQTASLESGRRILVRWHSHRTGYGSLPVARIVVKSRSGIGLIERLCIDWRQRAASM